MVTTASDRLPLFPADKSFWKLLRSNLVQHWRSQEDFQKDCSTQHCPLFILRLHNWKHLHSRDITLCAIWSMCTWAAARQGNCMLYMSSLSIFGSLYDYCNDFSVFFVKYLFMQPSPGMQLSSCDPYFIRNFSPICCSRRFFAALLAPLLFAL